MAQKVALILSGGGLAASYNVGALLALVEKYNFTDPDLVIAGSGSAGTASYYVAKQYASIRNIWSNLLSTKKFVSIWRFWRILDIDYLIDVVFKKQDPLNYQKVGQSKIEYLIAATNSDSGRVEYFSNQDGLDIFELMRATKAAPIFFGRQIKIGKEYYTDGINSTAAEFNLIKARTEGADKIIVLDCGVTTLKPFFKFWLSIKSKKYRQGCLADFKKRKQQVVSENILYIKPGQKSIMGMLNNSQDQIRKNIDLGYRDVLNSEEVKNFFANL